jgi:hypothetical protein
MMTLGRAIARAGTVLYGDAWPQNMARELCVEANKPRAWSLGISFPTTGDIWALRAVLMIRSAELAALASELADITQAPSEPID